MSLTDRASMLAVATTVCTVLGASAAAQTGAGIDPECEKLLPVGLVAQATGQKELALVPRDPTIGAGGTCNYARPGPGTKLMVVLVTVSRSAASSAQQEFARYKASEMYRTDQRSISGLGDEAFSTGETILVARRGGLVIALSAFQNIDLTTGDMKGPYLTRAQLIELARRVLAPS